MSVFLLIFSSQVRHRECERIEKKNITVREKQKQKKTDSKKQKITIGLAMKLLKIEVDC